MRLQEKSKVFDCWKFGYTVSQIKGMGYGFSLPKYILYFVGLYGGLGILTYVFRLSWIPYFVMAAITTLFVPSICRMTYQSSYEEKRFEDITAYMEQILYSFKRNAKIITSLEDTQILFSPKESKLYGAIAKAIVHVQTAETGEEIYREAFSYIEKEYGCKRLYKIHDFLVEAESIGGSFAGAIEMLLKDRKLWVDRVYELQREKKNVKIKLSIGIGLSFLICGMSTVMLPNEFGITNQLISQVVTVITILTNFVIWFIGQKKLSKSLLWEEGETRWKDTKKHYAYVRNRDHKKERKQMLFLGIVIGVLIVLIGKNKGISVILGVGIGMFFGILPRQKYNFARKKITREIEKVFPEWLISMSLQLQTDNLHVSLGKTIAHAPRILREEIRLLVTRISIAPSAIEPYLSFMHPIYLPDVTTAMKVMYSMAEYGTAETESMLIPLIERSEIMTDKAERLKAEDYIAGVSFLVLLPMLTGVVKMLTDLGLVVVSILSIVNQTI